MYHDQGLGAAQDDRLRDRRELDAGPAVHSHLARSRHGLRHRRPGQSQSFEHAGRDPAGEAVGPEQVKGRPTSPGFGIVPLRDDVLRPVNFGKPLSHFNFCLW